MRINNKYDLCSCVYMLFNILLLISTVSNRVKMKILVQNKANLFSFRHYNFAIAIAYNKIECMIVFQANSFMILNAI